LSKKKRTLGSPSHEPPTRTDTVAEITDGSASPSDGLSACAPPRTDAVAAWLVRQRLKIFLASLPWILFVINPNWPFQGLYHMDPWYFFGYFAHFPHYQLLTPNYQGERLTWILPGLLLARLFGHVYGTLVLHVVSYCISVLSMYYIVRQLRNERTAFATACLLGCHPFFIGANGWDYVDGGSIAYLLVAFAFLTKAALAERPRLYLVLAGAAWTALIVTYLFWLTFTPICLCYYMFLVRHKETPAGSVKDLVRHACRSALPFAGGAALAVFAFSVCHALIYGNRGFFLSESFREALYVSKISANPWLGQASGPTGWFRSATWLVFPALTLLVCAILGLRWLARQLSGDGPMWGAILSYCYCLGIMVVMTIRPSLLLASDYYTSILIPLLFLVLGLTLFDVPRSLSDRAFYLLLFAFCGICVLPLTKPARYGIMLIYGLFLPYAFGAIGVLTRLAWPRPKVTWIISLFCLSLASFGLTPAKPGSAWRVNYNGLAMSTRVSEAIDTIQKRVPYWAAPVFWIDNFNDPLTSEYRAIMCAVHLENSMWHYPKVDDKANYLPGTSIVLVTSKRNIFESANEAMTRAGMPLALASQDFISRAGISYWITIVTVLPSTKEIGITHNEPSRSIS
jgi:hypothetical protein